MTLIHKKKTNYFDVSERIVVITGGLGQLGRQFTNALLSADAKVVVLDLPAFNDIPNNIRKSFDNPSLLYFQSDITNKKSLQDSLHMIENVWRTPYALINNAALDSPPNASADENGPFEDYPDESLTKIMDVNIKGVIFASQIFGKAMKKNGGGSIINICSIYGLLSPKQELYEYRRQNGEEFYKPVGYSVTKSALLNLTRYLATYWAKDNIRVNTLTFAGVFNDQPKEFLENYCRHVPLGRMAWEDEYNGAVIFLISNASSYMTGSNLIIDGGWTSW